jgi:hypothetical protein
METKAVPSKESLERRSKLCNRMVFVMLALTTVAMFSFALFYVATTQDITKIVLSFFGIALAGFCLCALFINLRDRALKELDELYRHVESGVIVHFKSVPVERGHKTYVVVAGHNGLGQTVHQDKLVHPDKWRNADYGDTWPLGS